MYYIEFDHVFAVAAENDFICVREFSNATYVSIRTHMLISS